MSGQSGGTLLRSARQAIKRGDNSTARHLLLAASRNQPDDYRVWLWLAGITASAEEALSYIERAEALKPNDPTVAKARTWAEARLPKPGEPAPAPYPRPVAAPKVGVPATTLATTPGRRRRRWWLVGFSAFLLFLLILGATALWLTGPTWTSWIAETLARSELATASPPTTTPAATFQGTLPSPAATQISQPEASAQNTPAAPQATPNLPAKSIVAAAAEARPTWTITPMPTDTPTPTPTYAPTFVADQSAGQVFQPAGLGPNERWIDVSLSGQRLVAYEGTLPVFETLVSTGKAQYPTVTGQFRIWLRLESQDMDGYRLGFDYYLKGVPYVQYFYQDYALHGTYWHSNFGHPMSHGCVNLSPADAAWLFEFADYGTLVNVHP